jgi:acetoin utilization protein AcuC
MEVAQGSPKHARRAAFIHSEALESYSYPPDCPFRTERAGRARAILVSMDLLNGSGQREVAPAPAGRHVLETFHAPRYLDALEAAPKGHLDPEGFRMGIGTPDCPVFLGMYEYADLACGATLAGARLLLDDQAVVAFNPSGGYHHAHPAQAGGFCYVNDVAIACKQLAGAGRRVAFLDVDAHHCDGVQAAFYDRRDVLTVSFHEDGRTLFPGTGFPNEIGVGDGKGCSVNVPLPPGTYDEAYRKAFREVAVPLIGAYGPDVIVLELGMDCLAGDPLTHLSLTNNAYVDVLQWVLAFGRPVLAVGGGGYHVENTARGWALAWVILSGYSDGTDELNVGLGGVLLETTDWLGGLKDRALIPDSQQRSEVAPVLDATIEEVKARIFRYHGL